MGDFKKFGRKGDTFNRGPGGRPSFQSRPGFNRGGDERREMFKAVCAECGRPTEVPFRPSGDRPVYCKECFAAMGPQDRNDRPFVKRDNGPRPSFVSRPAGAFREGGPVQGSGEDKRLDDLKIQLATVISKLDKLINLQVNSGSVAHTTPKTAPAKAETLQETIVSATGGKKEKTKPASKKKAGTAKKK